MLEVRNSKLKLKVIVILVSIWVLYGVMNFVIQKLIIFPSYIELEETEARKNLERCVQAIERELHHLDALAYDWAAWDDTYRFIRDKNEDYLKSNLISSTLENTRLSTICFFDEKHTLVWGKWFNNDEGVFEPLPEVFTKDNLMLKRLVRHEKTDQSQSGLLLTEKGITLVASRPIITSEDEGPIRGALIMARTLDAKMVQTLAMQTRVEFEVTPIKGPRSRRDEELNPIIAQISSAYPYLIEEEPEYLRVYTIYKDIVREEALLMQTRLPMNITAKGTQTLRYGLISTITAVSVILLVILLLMERAVLSPIIRLTKHVVSIGRSGDLSRRLGIQRNDEIGTLASEFDRMLTHLDYQNIELEKLSVELIDDIVRRQEAEKKLKLEMEQRERLAEQREKLLEELNRKNKALEKMAISDSLTGLYNHQYIIKRLSKEMAGARRYKNPISIIMLDIDHFKQINDTLGHQTGDRVLESITDALQETLREVDIAGRYGGEEFLVILPRTGLDGAFIGAERIRQKIESIKWDIEGLSTTISAGVATMVEDEDASSLIARADQLLYKAKEAGRNRCEQ